MTAPLPTPPASTPAPRPLEGPLVISTVANWHSRLIEHLATEPHSRLDLSGVTEIDVFGLQLLLAARRSATEHGQTLTFAAVPSLFDDACASAGIARSLFSTPSS